MTGPMIMRYEAHLHRQWLQSLHELEAMQIRRQGRTSSLGSVDITGPRRLNPTPYLLLPNSPCSPTSDLPSSFTIGM
jgi:hypothetical protein